jgi:NADH-quinone oxidoreductase subunit C
MPVLTSRLRLALPPNTSGQDIALAAASQDVPAVAGRLLRKGWFLEDICGLDMAEGLALLYHFARWDRPARVVLRVLLPHGGPECPTIENIYPGASWLERETSDFFGIAFTGASNTTPLLLAEKLDPPPLSRKPGHRMSTHRLWPLAQWVGGANGNPLAEDLVGDPGVEAPAPKDRP